MCKVCPRGDAVDLNKSALNIINGKINSFYDKNSSSNTGGHTA